MEWYHKDVQTDESLSIVQKRGVRIEEPFTNEIKASIQYSTLILIDPAQISNLPDHPCS